MHDLIVLGNHFDADITLNILGIFKPPRAPDIQRQKLEQPDHYRIQIVFFCGHGRDGIVDDSGSACDHLSLLFPVEPPNFSSVTRRQLCSPYLGQLRISCPK